MTSSSPLDPPEPQTRSITHADKLSFKQSTVTDSQVLQFHDRLGVPTNGDYNLYLQLNSVHVHRAKEWRKNVHYSRVQNNKQGILTKDELCAKMIKLRFRVSPKKVGIFSFEIGMRARKQRARALWG